MDRNKEIADIAYVLSSPARLEIIQFLAENGNARLKNYPCSFGVDSFYGVPSPCNSFETPFDK